MNIADASVNYVIRQGLPISAALGILAMTFAVSFGVLTGVVSAAMRGSPLDVGLRLAATAGIALAELRRRRHLHPAVRLLDPAPPRGRLGQPLATGAPRVLPRRPLRGRGRTHHRAPACSTPSRTTTSAPPERKG